MAGKWYNEQYDLPNKKLFFWVFKIGDIFEKCYITCNRTLIYIFCSHFFCLMKHYSFCYAIAFPTQQFEVRSILREYYKIVSSSNIRTRGDRNILLTFACQFIGCRCLRNFRVDLKNEQSAILFKFYGLKLSEFNITAAQDKET